MIMVLPFRLKNIWFGIELEEVIGVEICGKTTLIPNAKAPLIGLMQKSGKILPIWSLQVLIKESSNKIKEFSRYIELNINNKIIALPVEEIRAVIPIGNGWVANTIYGLKIHRYLDKNLPIKLETVQEIRNTSIFCTDTYISQFPIEKITPFSIFD